MSNGQAQGKIIADECGKSRCGRIALGSLVELIDISLGALVGMVSSPTPESHLENMLIGAAVGALTGAALITAYYAYRDPQGLKKTAASFYPECLKRTGERALLLSSEAQATV